MEDKRFAFGATSWLQIVHKFGHLPDSETVQYGTGGIWKFTTTVGNAKARALESIMDFLPKTRREAWEKSKELEAFTPPFGRDSHHGHKAPLLEMLKSLIDTLPSE
jgi:hypothetical protein